MKRAVRWTYGGLNVTPIPGTKRSVAGGTAIDIRIDDVRSTVTYATVNAALLERVEE